MKKDLLSKQCPLCGYFPNRGVTVDACIIKNNQVLLIKRGVDPYKGYWALPGGYVDWNETIEKAMKREVHEETGLKVNKFQLVGVYSSPKRHPQQAINVLFYVKVNKSIPKPSDDAKEIKWFDLENLPKKMAFDHYQNINRVKNLIFGYKNKKPL